MENHARLADISATCRFRSAARLACWTAAAVVTFALPPKESALVMHRRTASMGEREELLAQNMDRIASLMAHRIGELPFIYQDVKDLHDVADILRSQEGSIAPAQSAPGCICQDEHRKGYCTEPGCSNALRAPEAADAGAASADAVRALQSLLNVFQKRADKVSGEADARQWSKGSPDHQLALGQVAGLHFCIGAVAAAMDDTALTAPVAETIACTSTDGKGGA